MKKGTEIKTWEDICEVLQIDPVKSLAWAENLDETDKAPMLAIFKLSKLSQVFWGGIVPNFKDRNQYKYFPYFYGNRDDHKSGFGFSDTDTCYDDSSTYVGARLSYPSDDLAEHAGTVFIDWYRDFMLVQK